MYAPIVDQQNEFYWRYSAQADFVKYKKKSALQNQSKFIPGNLVRKQIFLESWKRISEKTIYVYME
jgi:hypothetical protein